LKRQNVSVPGLIVDGSNYSTIYAGLLGYNGALTAAAVGVTFYAPTLASFFNAVLAVLFTAGAQKAFALILTPVHLPRTFNLNCFNSRLKDCMHKIMNIDRITCADASFRVYKCHVSSC
jgi:hypothetical protein